MGLKLKSKTLLSVGALSVIVLPTTIMVSCGKTETVETKNLLNKLESAKRMSVTIAELEAYKTGDGYERFATFTSSIATGIGILFDWNLTKSGETNYKILYSLSRSTFEVGEKAKYQLTFKVSIDIELGNKKIVQSPESIEIISSDDVLESFVNLSLLKDQAEKIETWAMSGTPVANSILNFLQTEDENTYYEFNSTIAQALGFNSMPSLARGIELKYSLITKEISENDKGVYFLNVKMIYKTNEYVVNEIVVRSSDLVNQDVINMQFAIQKLQHISSWIAENQDNPLFSVVNPLKVSNFTRFDETVSNALGFKKYDYELEIVNGKAVNVEYTLTDTTAQLPDNKAKYNLNFKVTVDKSSMTTRIPFLIESSDNIPHTTLTVANHYSNIDRTTSFTYEEFNREYRSTGDVVDETKLQSIYIPLTKQDADFFGMNWRDDEEFKKFTIEFKWALSKPHPGQVARYVVIVKVTKDGVSSESTALDFESSNATPHTKVSIAEVLRDNRTFEKKSYVVLNRVLAQDWTSFEEDTVAKSVGLTDTLPNEGTRFVWEYKLAKEIEPNPGEFTNYTLKLRVKDGASDSAPLELDPIKLVSNDRTNTLQRNDRDRIEQLVKENPGGFTYTGSEFANIMPSEIVDEATEDEHDKLEKLIKDAAPEVFNKITAGVQHSYSATPSDKNDAGGEITITVLISNTNTALNQANETTQIKIKGLQRTTERLKEIEQLLMAKFNGVLTSDKPVSQIDAIRDLNTTIDREGLVTVLGVNNPPLTTAELRGVYISFNIVTGSGTGSGIAKVWKVSVKIQIGNASITLPQLNLTTTTP